MTATITYLLYLVISSALTGWVGRTLFRNGQVFLVEVFAGEEALARAVNHPLAVGFYLVNFGFVSLFRRLGHGVGDARTAIEAAVARGRHPAARPGCDALHEPVRAQQVPPPRPGPRRTDPPLAIRRHHRHPPDNVRTATVLYDASCALCRRAKGVARVAGTVAAAGVRAGRLDRGAQPLPGPDHQATLKDLTVVADTGEVWQAERARVLCLWARPSPADRCIGCTTARRVLPRPRSWSTAQCRCRARRRAGAFRVLRGLERVASLSGRH
ncbi:MAG: hypothetical protein ABJA87_08985 [bacterium]